jgi:hypothetical protein
VDTVTLRQLTSFVTADGSSIRELAGPRDESARSDTVMTGR